MARALIRAEVIVETSQLSKLATDIDDYPNQVIMVASGRIEREVLPSFLSQLRIYPGQVVHPFEFASERSKRWYHWAARHGLIRTDGSHYIRTGNLANSWVVALSIGDGAMALIARNANKAVRYVTGNRQVAGHIRTGWVRHSTTIEYWATQSRNILMEVAKDVLKGLGK